MRYFRSVTKDTAIQSASYLLISLQFFLALRFHWVISGKEEDLFCIPIVEFILILALQPMLAIATGQETRRVFVMKCIFLLLIWAIASYFAFVKAGFFGPISLTYLLIVHVRYFAKEGYLGAGKVPRRILWPVQILILFGILDSLRFPGIEFPLFLSTGYFFGVAIIELFDLNEIILDR